MGTSRIASACPTPAAQKFPEGLNLSGPRHELPAVRVHRNASRLAVPAAAAAVIMGLAAPAAAADVTISPNTAEQGTGINVDIAVTNDSPSTAITKVGLTLPADHPIAEVYPLSAEDWAPALTNRKLDPPMKGLHGSLLDQATATVTWTAMPGKALQPGRTAHLRVAMGPLPETDRLDLTVQPTYADGSTGPAKPGIASAGATAFGATRVALKLTPAGAAADVPLSAEPAGPADVDGGGSLWSAAGWIAAALFAAFGIVATLRARREWHGDAPAPAAKPHGEARAAEASEQGSGGAREPAVTGPRVTSWSYRDGP